MLTDTTAATRETASRPPSLHVVVRRRRVLGVLSGAAGGCALLASAGLSAFWWLALVFVALSAAYLVLVARLRHSRVRRQMDQAFGTDAAVTDEFDWRGLEQELHLAIADEAGTAPATPSVEVDNRAIGRFLICWLLGWVLTPVVTVMRWVRGDPSEGLAERIVKWQQYGRSQSLRLLTVGAAASVGLTAVGGLGASAGASPIAAAVSLTTQPAGTPSTYTVVRGDTLSAIARRSGESVAALAATNHLADPNLIIPGETLTVTGALAAAVPGVAASYTVRPGDDLYAIARAHGTTVAALAETNDIANPNLIFPGQVLSVPPAPVLVAARPAPAPPPIGAPRAGAPLVAARTAPAPAFVAAPPAAAAQPSPAPAPTPAAPAAALAALPLPAKYLRGGSVDQGVDYDAPGGTPLYAMGPGKIIREGMSGFGPNCPVLQITAGPLAGKTVYYGHAGADLVPVGATVAAGQQISVVGYGIVGYSTGPHLEVGFYPPGANGAGRSMLAYLNGVVGHSTGG